MTTRLKNEIERYLTFSLTTEEYGIPLLQVKEVIAMPDITPVPYTPGHFLGIMNLRGQVISVIDLRLKLGMTVGESSDEKAVIILDLGIDQSTLYLGVVVDSVNSVLSLEHSQISPTPEINSDRKTDYITGVARSEESQNTGHEKNAQKLILLLDIAKALDMGDLQAIRRKAGEERTAA